MKKENLKREVLLYLFTFFVMQTSFAQYNITGLPYTCDFEDAAENAQWTLLNGTQTNKWYISNAASYSGSKSLYISNNNGGASNTYSTSPVSVISYVYAYRVLNFTKTGLHTISFNWRCRGDENWDNFRAFLVPDTISLEAGNAYGNTDGTNLVPSNWIAVSGVLSDKNTWQKFENSNVYVQNTGIYKLVFFWKNNGNWGTNPPAAIDNIVVRDKIVIVNIQNESIFGDSAGIVNFNVTTKHIINGSYEATVTNLPEDISVLGQVTINNNSGILTLVSSANTVTSTYHNLILTIDGTVSEEFSLVIAGVPTNLPYIHDFEDEQENTQWTLLNGNQTNKWHISNAVSNGGANSLYISFNNGISNSYYESNYDSSYVFAYRTLNFLETGIYTISFDWRCIGNWNFDNARVFLVPDNISLQAGNSYGNSEGYTAVPENWVAISEILYNQSTWQNFKRTDFLITNTGLYKLVFFWKNDGIGGNGNLSAAIDNIVFTPKSIVVGAQNESFFEGSAGTITFPVSTGKIANGNYMASVTNLPAEVSVSGQVTINNNSGILTFTVGSNTAVGAYSNLTLSIDGAISEDFTLVIAGIPSNLPYIYDFENEQENAQWTLLNGTETNKWCIDNGTSNSGANSLYISDNYGFNSYTNIVSYVYAYRVLNFTETGLHTIRFNWKCRGYSEYINVRVFLVPDNIQIKAGNAYGNTGNINNVPANWIAVSEVLNTYGLWQNFTNTNVYVPNTGLYKLVFFWKNNNLAGMLPPAAIDNIVVRYKTVNVDTQNNNIYGGLTGTVTFPITTRHIANGNYTATLANLPATVSVSGQVTIDNNFGVLTLAGDANTVVGIYSNLTLTIDGTTSDEFSLIITGFPSELTYSCDFEDEQENTQWTLLNGTQTNKWHIGNAVSNSGVNSLYISADNGITNDYDCYSYNDYSYVYAYRVLNFTETGLHTISFNWKNYGVWVLDNVRAFLVPDFISIEAGNAYGNIEEINIVPPNWIAVSGILYYQYTWQNFVKTNVYVPNTGLYKLVFFWKNSILGGIPPPAAIDNITVYKNFIPVSNITNVPLTAFIGVPLPLTGTINPYDASNQTILWSIENAGTTEAIIEEDILFTTATGTVTVRATVENGLEIGTNYWKDFNISVTKSNQSAPDAPTLLSKTQTSIILNEITGCEYRMNNGEWQSSNVFSELTSNTLYNFKARKVETSFHFASPESPGATFKTDMATLVGTVVITGSPVFGETLTANTISLYSIPEISDLGTLSYQWKRGNIEIGTDDPVYTLVENDIINVITVTVTAANCDESVTSDPTELVIKAIQIAPNAPTLLSKTQSIITLNEIEGCEYRIDGNEWQLLNVFSGLSPDTEYGFEARKFETNTHFHSEPSSPPTKIITEPLNTYIITASVNDPSLGTITPEGETTVEEGGSLTYTITPFDNNEIIDVLVNWVRQGVITNYTFENVQSDGAIEAIFGTVGIYETELGNIKIYSNKNSIYIKNESSKPLKMVEIFDMTGRLVYKDVVTDFEKVILLRAATGIYAVKVIWENGNAEKRKLRIEN